MYPQQEDHSAAVSLPNNGTTPSADAWPNIHDADSMTTDWTYYVYVGLTMLPTYLFFKLWIWMGWELYVNN